MRVSESTGVLKRYREMAWEAQQTFLTPLDDLPRFVHAIMSALAGAERSLVIFDRVVFEPRYALAQLYAKHSLPLKWYGDELTIEAETAAQGRELLQAVLSEWIDFLFVPTPTRFMIYVDHDEYTTFLAPRAEELSGIVDALTAAGFRSVEYVRKF